MPSGRLQLEWIKRLIRQREDPGTFLILRWIHDLALCHGSEGICALLHVLCGRIPLEAVVGKQSIKTRG